MDPADPKRGFAFTSAEFPSLREFLRGYLHEDWHEEHGSLEGAVRQFCQDADPEQRQEVAEQWRTFRQQTEHLPWERICDLLTRSLGSAWYPASKDDLETVSRVLTETP